MASDFTHLHVHSHYSLLDGLGKIDDLLARTKELGMSSLAITDHGAMYGVVEFVKKAKEYDIKPIIGLEAYLAPKGHTNRRGKIDANPRHVSLLAQNNQGYKNLIQLTTQAHVNGYYYKPRIDYQLLEKYHEGLIVLSGCLNGDIPKAIIERREEDVKRLIEWHLNLFGRQRFYFEVQHHPNLPEQILLNEALINLGKKYQIGLVATADSHYIHPEDAEAQDVLICVQTGKKVHIKDRLCMLGEDFSLKSPAELKEAWKNHPAAIDNTQAIAEACQVKLEFGVNRLPRYPLPADTTPDAALRQLCEQGLAKRYPQVNQEISNRLNYELDVIGTTGFASYFLIVSDFVNEAKRRGILVGPGRGSAAGSIVSYLTNITNLDPLKYNLLFERFLNPERVSMPDIDLDFADDRRDEVIEYVRGKYGAQHVAQIITFGTMAARAAVRDAGRALDYPYTFCDRIAKAIPPFLNFEQALKQSGELREIYQHDPQAKKLIDTAKRLEGVARHASTHAAGVVITDEPLTEYVPLQLANTGDGHMDTVTQYAMGAVEALGLLKMDFLGLKNLTIIQNTLARIKQAGGQLIDLDTLPADDPATFALLQTGKTTGVFQLESSGMKRYLKELAPTEFEDIISILALYRPGPMDSIPDFIAAKHGRKEIKYLHPILKPILEKTYGVIVTQDQVLQIARDFAGFSYGEADILRKAVGKKIKALLIEQRAKFIKSSQEQKEIGATTAAKVWDFIEPFARYGFNRAHAACYAAIAYQTAYLKANYPAEFMAALLTSDEGNTDRQAIEVAEALSLGIKVLPPDINESERNFTVVASPEGAAIRFGLAAIKNVGAGVGAAIIGERAARGKFADLFDLFRRLDSKDFNRKSVESLARAGAMDSIAERNQVLTNVATLLDFNRALRRKTDTGQRGLFGERATLPAPRVILTTSPPAAKDERLRWEKELLGLYLSEHPLSELQAELAVVTTPLAEIGQVGIGNFRVAGVITRLSKFITKSQQPMLFVTLEDLGGKLEMLVFPKLLQKTEALWQDGASLIVAGKLSDKDGEIKMLVDEVSPLTKETVAQLRRSPTRQLPVSPATASVVIHVPAAMAREQLQQLQTLLARHHAPGGLPVQLLIPQGGALRRLATSYQIPNEQAIIAALATIVGQQAIRYT